MMCCRRFQMMTLQKKTHAVGLLPEVCIMKGGGEEGNDTEITVVEQIPRFRFPSTSLSLGDDDSSNVEMSSRAELSLRRAEFIAWSQLAVPSGFRSLFDLLPWLCSLSMIGRVGTRELSALSLTETWIYGWMTVSWTAIAITQSTLVSQAHGARNVRAMRTWALFTFIASLFLACVITCAWLFAPAALNSFGFDPAMTSLAQNYVLYAIPVLFFEAFNITASVYLVSMQTAVLPLAIGAFNAIVDVAASYLMIFGAEPELPRLKNALQAAALGWTISSAISVAVNAAALRWAVGRELDFGDEANRIVEEKEGLLDNDSTPDYDVLEGGSVQELLGEGGFVMPWRDVVLSRAKWGTYLAQLIPNVSVVAISTIQYVVISFLAAGLGPVDIATHNILICFFEIIHTATQGMAEATAVRVGSHLGAGDARAARRTAIVALVAVGSWGLGISVIGFCLHEYIARVFSGDAAVLAAAAQLRALMWSAYALISVGDAAGGVLEGQGRSGGQMGAVVVGIGIAVPLAFMSVHLTSLGLRGLWGSMLIGYGCIDVINIALVYFSDWDQLARDAVGTAKTGEEGGRD